MNRTISIGPLRLLFENVNTEMGIRQHTHQAQVTVTYLTVGRHGFPSFESTNRALLAHLHKLTLAPFKDATNEDVADQLFQHLDGYTDPEWVQWGGDYSLLAVTLGVEGVFDDIGHDAGMTLVTCERSVAEAMTAHRLASLPLQPLANPAHPEAGPWSGGGP
jgi:hypothetical protein